MAVLQVHRLGTRTYGAVFAAMKAHTDAADAGTPDQIWLVEHLPVFTQGQAGRAEHVLMAGDIPVVKSDRGGQVTYHGPGQLVVYALLDLQSLRLNVRQLVGALEQAAIALLAGYGIAAELRAGAPGVYVGAAKIASLGLRVRRGRSYHGLAVNVAMDLAPFDRINPCGYSGLRMTQLSDLLPPARIPTMGAVAAALLDALAPRLGYASWAESTEPPTALGAATSIAIQAEVSAP